MTDAFSRWLLVALVVWAAFRIGRILWRARGLLFDRSGNSGRHEHFMDNKRIIR
jgi:hypothetical protein